MDGKIHTVCALNEIQQICFVSSNPFFHILLVFNRVTKRSFWSFKLWGKSLFPLDDNIYLRFLLCGGGADGKDLFFLFFFFYITAKQVSVFLRPITALRIIRVLWTLQNTKCSFHLFPMTESHYSFLKAWLLNGGNERCKLKVRRSERKEAV